MRKLRYYVYKLTNSPGLIEVAKRREIYAEWVVEAGCHDGSDTIKFASLSSIRKIYAFEPDPIARRIAIERCFDLQTNGTLEIYPFALTEKSQKYNLLSNGGKLGTGSSQVIDAAEAESESGPIELIQGRRLDEIIQPKNNQGILWLDVEGGALGALKGSSELLYRFRLIQIEVEFQDMWGNRKSNFKKVIHFLKKQDFLLFFAPIYPGLFGDLTFIKKAEASVFEKIRSVALVITITFLHSIVYPVTHRKKFKIIN